MDERIPQGDLRRFHALAVTLANESRQIIHESLKAGFEIKHKPDYSFVTSVDLKVEERLRELIAARFPTHGIIGEEYPPTRADAEFQWLIDPIDGTEDFVHGIPLFGTIIALHHQGKPIVGLIDQPLLGTQVSATLGGGTYYNQQRIRLRDNDATPSGSERVILSARANFTRYGDHGHFFDKIVRAHPNHRIYRTCYGHVCAITGAADAALDYGNRIWDLGASQILTEEAGGKYICVQEVEVADGGKIYGAVFGKARLVASIASVFETQKRSE